MPCWWLCKASSFQPRDQVVMSTTASRLPLLPWQTFPSTRLYAGFAGIACVAAAMLHADLLLRPPLKIMSQTWLAQQLSLLAAHSQQQPSSCLAHPYVARAAAAVVHVAALAVGTPFIAAAPCAAWFVSVIYRHCRRSSTDSGDGGDCTRFLRFRDPRVHERMKGKRIPIEDMYEMYFDGKLDLLQPGGGACLLKDVLSRRHEFVRYTFSLTGHLPFLLFRWIPDVLLGHSQRGDTAQVRDHYDRGTILVHENPLSGGAAEDDFFGMFLGDTMIYTAGIAARLEEEQTLEEMQRNKLALVCSKLRLKPGDRHLDIGCGWGTLVQYAAAVHGASSTGVTLSRNQAQFAAARAKAMGLDDQTQARYLCMDYRDIPRHPAAAAATRYDKISCLEMAEHVGVKNFHSFLGQVRDTLNDDGIFFLQIAGLRRPFQVGLLAASQYDCTQSHTHLHLSSDIPLSILSVPSGSIYKEMPRKRSISISNASILNHSGDSSCPSGAHRRLTQQHSHGHPLHSEHVLPIHYEDLVWGLFMAKYIFPGADASMPLGWVVGQLERAGFEVAQVDNVGVHYSLTIHRWYRNWVANKDRVICRYGQRWYRTFEFFLAWSSYIASSGAATCYQITCHKNLNRFDRTGLRVPAPCAVEEAASSLSCSSSSSSWPWASS